MVNFYFYFIYIYKFKKQQYTRNGTPVLTDTDICRSANHTDTASDTRLTHLLRRPFGFILTITHSMHHSFYYNWSVFKELLQYLSDFICIRYDLSL